MPKFAANLTMMFQEVEFLDRFNAAAKAGFSAVEYLFPYDYSPQAIADCLNKASLKQALFNMPPGDWAAGDRGTAAIPERMDEFRASAVKAVDYAKIIGTPLLHVMAGIADASNPLARQAYEDSIAYAADLAGAEGIGVVIEPINSRDMPGYFLNSFEQAEDIIHKIGRPNLQLQFDVYHRQVMRGDVMTGLQALMPIIGHVQIASVPKRNEPGSGELDDFRIFAELDALGYAGYVGCEYRPAGETVAGLSWIRGF